MEKFIHLNPILQAFICTFFTYSVTALGASVVFFFKNINQKLMDSIMGFSGGVMIAASFWSLLEPALELCLEINMHKIFCAIGFFIGGLFIVLSDVIMQHFTKIENKKKRQILLFSSVTLHNIPEGMAVGVAFGGLALNINGITIWSALSLALGIGLQNFPEGACISLPMRRDGCSRTKAFFYGQLSAIVEPIAGVLGVLFVFAVKSVLPILLSFSAGAMIAVVCSELIPEAFKDNKFIASIGVILGFIIMMLLDVLL